MTRLIDADIFKENIDDICNNSGDLDPITEAVRKFMKNHIDGQTTVEAIPIDWIKEWCESQDLEYVRLGIEKLIHAFNKEKKDAEQVRHGKWLDMGDFEKCSACHCTHLKEFQSYYGTVNWVKTPYCPYCGAKMGGEEE